MAIRVFPILLEYRKKEGMIFMACTVTVVNGTLPRTEVDAYIHHAVQKYGAEPIHMDITVDGEDVELLCTLPQKPFHRIRRITGYLVGTLDRFNNAKRSEERERIKHPYA